MNIANYITIGILVLHTLFWAGFYLGFVRNDIAHLREDIKEIKEELKELRSKQ